MAKIIDRIALIGILFLIFTLWATYVTHNLIIGILIAMILSLILGKLLKPSTKIKTNAEDFIPYLISLPFSAQNDLLLKVLSPEISPRKQKNGLIRIREKELLLPFLRFAEVNADEIFKKTVFAKRRGYTKLTLLVYKYDDAGFTKVKPYLALPLEIVSVVHVIDALKSANQLPNIPKQSKVKPKLNALFKVTFNRKNVKYFLLSGLTMGFLAYFTPLTLYYLIFCTLSLTAAALCFLKKNEKKATLFIK